MRLLIAVLERALAESVRDRLYGMDERWEITVAQNGAEALRLLQQRRYDLLLLHACLPRVGGANALSALDAGAPLCPPRVLFLSEQSKLAGGCAADCVVPLHTDAVKICRLLNVLSEKPLPMLAAAHMRRVQAACDRFLDAIAMRADLKGRAYSAWLLSRMIPSPRFAEAPMGVLYAACAAKHQTTPAAVERCLRVAVEGVFTAGSISGIERYFGATVDPERGKPTNRAFLCQATQQLRHSLEAERSGNSSDMHHSPAAPTIV